MKSEGMGDVLLPSTKYSARRFSVQDLAERTLDFVTSKIDQAQLDIFQSNNTANMGRVRTKTVKKSAKVIIERYYPKLTLDFETNKRICDEIAVIPSKRLRNKVRRLIRWGHHSAIIERYVSGMITNSLLPPDRRLHHPLDEAYPAWPGTRHLLQAARRGA